MLRAPWECFDDAPTIVGSSNPSAAGGSEGEISPSGRPGLPRSPARRRELAYQLHKMQLAREWLGPRRAPAPWEQATRTYPFPQTWNELPVQNPVENVVTPASLAWNKGAGTALTAEEIEQVRADEREAFKQRLAQQWRWNIAHL